MNVPVFVARVAATLAACTATVEAQQLFLGIRTPSPVFTREIHTLTVGAGVTTPITFAPSMVPLENSIPFEIDQRTGDLIIAARPAGGGDIGIFRTVVFAGTAISQTLLATIPGTSAFTPADFYRERTGGMLLSMIQGSTFAIHRVGFTSTGGLTTTAIPISNPFVFANQSVSRVASLPDGTILFTGPLINSPSGVQSSIFSLPAAGGTVQAFLTQGNVNFRSVDVGPTGSVIGGGLSISLLPPGPFNLFCAGPTFVGGGGFVLGVDDIYVDNNDVAWMMMNGSPPTLQTHNTAPCGLGAVIAHGLPAGTSMVRVVVREPILGDVYGYSCTTPTYPVAGMPTNLVVTPPVIGGNWVCGLERGVPNGLCVFSLGFNEATFGALPLPLDLTGFGAPNCAAWQSNEATFTTTATATGTATFTLPIPLNPVLIGSRLFGQWVVFTATNPAGFVTTNATVSTIN